MKAAKPAKEHQTAEKQRAISLQNSLKRHHQSISDTNNIPPQRLNQIVRNVNYISKQLLADLQVTEETKQKALNQQDRIDTFYQAMVAVSKP